MKIVLIVLSIINFAFCKQLSVITTLFPIYDFARVVGGSDATVSLLLPSGVEPHSYEPTPKDIVKISKADLFIYTLDVMEPWIEDIVSTSKSKTLLVVEAGKGVDLLHNGGGHDHHHDHGEECGYKGEADPHIWLDPLRAVKIVDNIVASFEKISGDTVSFRKRGNILKSELIALDSLIETTLSPLKKRTIVSGGHFAFRYFTERYNLEHISPFSGFSPNAEPSPKSVARVINAVKSNGYSVIFFEELVDPRVAKTISKESGAQLLLLHGAHNVSSDELKSGIGYIDIMKGNLERVVQGLR